MISKAILSASAYKINELGNCALCIAELCIVHGNHAHHSLFSQVLWLSARNRDADDCSGTRLRMYLHSAFMRINNGLAN